MDQTTILIIGAFVLLLLIGGIGFTVLEFRKMAKEPEKYGAPAYDEEEETEDEREEENEMKT